MIKSVDHFGIAVSNLENAIEFFTNCLGFKMKGSIRTSKGKQVDETMQMPNVLIRVCFLTFPDSEEVVGELHEYVEPRGKSIDLTLCNFGVTHIGFKVNNIEKMYEDLTAKGVVFNNKPKWLKLDGVKKNGAFCICYLKGPDGITIEFMENADVGDNGEIIKHVS